MIFRSIRHPVTDMDGRFLRVGATVVHHKTKRVGTVRSYGTGWVRIEGANGRWSKAKPTRVRVAA